MVQYLVEHREKFTFFLPYLPRYYYWWQEMIKYKWGSILWHDIRAKFHGNPSNISRAIWEIQRDKWADTW